MHEIRIAPDLPAQVQACGGGARPLRSSCRYGSTAGEAMQMNDTVVLVPDEATLLDVAHDAPVENRALRFAAVMRTGQALTAIGRD